MGARTTRGAIKLAIAAGTFGPGEMTGQLITLLTDFGSVDTFVGQMKGVLYSHCRDIAVVDLTHEIPVQDVRAGAIHLGAAWRWFPTGTIHVAVVDPGVGSTRMAVGVAVSDHVFLLPDNGLISAVIAEHEPDECVTLDPDRFTTWNVSGTFHGRDVFAVAAGLLASGSALGDLGDPVSRDSLVSIEIPIPIRDEAGIAGEVLMIDHFGNAVTNISAGMIESSEPVIESGRIRIEGISSSYSSVGSGELLALYSSIDTLEIAIRDASAQKAYDLRVGDRVLVRG